jgi:Amt family ammonium transporter
MAWIAVNTNLAAAAGVVGALISIWITTGKPDVGMSLNGALAGLVGITAPCANVSAAGSVAIGLIAGVIVVFSVRFFDKIKVDDPVGAISVHGVCGAWGTIAVALFDITGGASLGAQLLGVGVCFAWTFSTAMALFAVIKYTVGLRVDEEVEIAGLDLHEHGAEAYSDFAARIH